MPDKTRQPAKKKPATGRPRTPEAKEAAALKLAAGWTILDTAAEIGVNQDTVRRWRRDPDFLAMVAAFRAEITERTLNLEATLRAQALLRAAKALPNPDDRIGVRAADVLLRNTAKPLEQAATTDADGQLLTYLRSLGD